MTFSQLTTHVVTATGRPWAFAVAVAVVLVWLAFGPFVGFTNTFYQLTINTGTTIITFLMVFLIQAAQNRDGLAIQTKLDALIEASRTQNRFIGIDNLDEETLREMRSKLLNK